MFATKSIANGLLRTSKSLVKTNNKSSLLRTGGGGATAWRPMTVLSKESAEEYKQQNYTQKMKQSGKPVSPHVLIYAFPVVAISSITNRVTGCALSVGCAGLGLLEIVGGTGTSLWVMQTIGSQGFLIAATAKFAVSYTAIYHYLGAVRHFAWDFFPDMLTNEEVEKSAYALLGGSAVLAGATVFF